MTFRSPLLPADPRQPIPVSFRDPGKALTPGQSDTLFATADWFAIWGEAFGRSGYGIWHPARTGVAPGVPYLKRRIRIAGIPLTLAFGAANFFSPRYDITEGPLEPEDLERLMGDLGVSGLTFHGLSGQSRLMKSVAPAASPSSVQIEYFEDAPFVDCTLDWGSYWSGRGKNLRANLSGIDKQLRGVRSEVLELREWSDISRMRDTIYEVEASGWKGRQGTAIGQDETVRSFFDRLLLEFSKRDLIRLFVLVVEGDVIAFELNTLYRGVLTGLKGGFRETHAKLSPGQLLRHRFLQRAFADPDITIYDMLGPATETKRRWSTGAETLHTLRVFRRTLGGRLLHARYVTASRLVSTFRARMQASSGDATSKVSGR
jgi:Acetyltransferase (GNAT) domain